MKTSSFLILLFGWTNSFTQNHEIDFNYRFGVASSTFQVLNPTSFTRLDYKKLNSVYDHGFVLTYKYKIWQKYNLFISAGIDFSESKHYQKIIEGDGGYHLDNIVVKKNRLTLHLFGLNKQINFFDNNLILDIGCHLVNRIYFDKTDYYHGDLKSNNEDWIKYKYDLTTHYGSYFENDAFIQNKPYIHVNLDYNLHLKVKIFKNTFLNFGFNYSRNNIFFYDYTYSVNYYLEGSTTPTSTYSFLGLLGANNPKYGVRDHYIYFNLGLTYKFDKTDNSNP